MATKQSLLNGLLFVFHLNITILTHVKTLDINNAIKMTSIVFDRSNLHSGDDVSYLKVFI